MSRKQHTEVSFQRERLRQMRDKRGVSYSELAEISGVSRRQVIRYETGESQPTADSIARLAKALECSTDFLLGITHEPGAVTPDIPPEVVKWARAFSDLPKPLKDAIRAIVRSASGNGNGH